MKKIISIALVSAMTLSALCGCGSKDDGKTKLSVGLWPDETQGEWLTKKNEQKDKFMQENPDIEIIPDTYAYDTKTFNVKASANQLPNLYVTYFTEIKQIVNSGYAADITDVLEEEGYDKQINEQVLEYCKDENGKIIAIPQSVYAQGLYINKKLFKEAGLVNSDGSIKVPDTFDELMEYAAIIKEKTGKAGFVMPTTNNVGGWHFLNIAWAFGVEFEKQREDGSWEATFNTQEARDALQFIKDLRWKYDALPTDTVLDQAGIQKQFAIGEAAMFFSSPPVKSLFSKYGMKIEDAMCVKMPKGKAGRFSQMGGGVYMFSKNSTKEQIKAGLKWLDFTGATYKVTDDTMQQQKDSFELDKKNNEIIIDREAFSIWTNAERNEKMQQLRAKYSNVDPKDYEQYYDFSDVTIRPEPTACAQQLYSVLDSCIQEVVTNKDANVDELIKTANEDFQKNHLDKM